MADYIEMQKQNTVRRLREQLARHTRMEPSLSDDEPPGDDNAEASGTDGSVEADGASDPRDDSAPDGNDATVMNADPDSEGSDTTPLPVLVPPFPLSVFPAALRPFVLMGAKARQCAPDLIAIPMLVTAATMMGTAVELEVKAGDWREGPRLYCAIITDSGGGKSPGLQVVTRPLDDLEAMLAALEVEDGRRLYTTDPTTEALSKLLQRNPRGLLYRADELTGWVDGLNQYKGGKGADLQWWLSAWSGDPVMVDRKSDIDHPIRVRAPFVNVVGGLTPDFLSKLADPQGRRSGFLERILFAFPRRVPPGRWTTAAIPERDQLAWSRTLTFLRRRIAPKQIDYVVAGPNEDTVPVLIPHVLPFTPEGAAEWERLYNAHADERRALPAGSPLAGTWAKVPAHAARFALVIHLLRVVCGEVPWSGDVSALAVDAESVRRAFKLMDYFKTHARRVFQRMPDASDAEDQRAFAWIRRRGGQASARDLVTYKIAKDTDHAKAIILRLAQRGLGIAASGQRRDSLVFQMIES